MVLPILIPSNLLMWAAWDRARPRRRRKTIRQGKHFASEEEATLWRLSRRFPRAAKYRPRAIGKKSLARQAGIDAKKLDRHCEQLSSCVLRRWQKLSGVRGGQVQRLARSCDAAGCVQTEPGDRHAVEWMLQVMYWRGCSHPLALMHKPLHPATGVMRWLAKVPLQAQHEQPRWIVERLYASMTAYRHRAGVIAKRLIFDAPHGRLRLWPQLLKDQYWRTGAVSQNCDAKRP